MRIFSISGLYIWHKNHIVFLALSVLFLAVFIFFAVKHGKCKKQANWMETLCTIHDQYIARTKHDFSALSDDGSDLDIKKHAYCGDLDLFGPKSIFALINVAHTEPGRTQLRDWLLYASTSQMEIVDVLKRQEAVMELSSEYEKVEELEASTKINTKKKGSPQALLTFIGAGELSSKTWMILRVANTALLYLSFIPALIFGGYVYFAPAAFFVLQLLLMAIQYKSNAAVFDYVERFYPELSAYSNIFSTVEETEVKADYLQEIKKRLMGDAQQSSGRETAASNQLYDLHKICLFVQARMQPLLYFVLNVLLPFDEICIALLEKWRKTEGNGIESKLNAIGEWEALMSLSVMHAIYPDGCLPVIRDSAEPYFKGKGIGHPLIPEARIVRNDFDLAKGCAMITGSNMSGKTTLLRTVGINTVLALAGAWCPAESLEISMMQVAASMRIEDDLGEGVSTFYAELIKIERIVKMAQKGRPLLYLIDEIFRGTNSKDRTDGAWIVLKKLNSPSIIGLMSTHDYELCKMNENGEVNLCYYHFSEYYDDDGLHFDYKLKDGMSTETNAKYLMKLVGIDD